MIRYHQSASYKSLTNTEISSSAQLTDEILPSYSSPPVTEALIAVQFDRIRGFTNAHFGSFWEMIGRDKWPHVSEVPPLPSQFERFGGDQSFVRKLQLQLTQEPACRIQFRNAANDQMIQVQNNYLVYNWIGQGADYPRFPVLRGDFEKVLSSFNDFLRSVDFQPIEPTQWEITYVNIIPQGTIWNTTSDWSFFRPMEGVESNLTQVEFESFSGQWHYVLPDQRGRLHVQWQHVPGSPKATEQAVRLTFTARGPTSNQHDLSSGIHLGRASIVNTFKELMSDQANTFWGLSNGKRS